MAHHFLNTENIMRYFWLRGGGHPEIFLGPIFAFFGISKNCMKKEKFWCRLEQNRVTGGRTARVFAKTLKMDPKLKNGHFWRFFKNSQKWAFLSSGSIFGAFAKTRAVGPPVTRFCSNLHQNFSFFMQFLNMPKNAKNRS